MSKLTKKAKLIVAGITTITLAVGLWISTSDAGGYGSQTRSYQSCPYYSESTGRHRMLRYEGSGKNPIQGNRGGIMNEQMLRSTRVK